MAYRVYSGPHGAEALKPLEKDRMLFKEFRTLDEALNWSLHVNNTGLTALLIEGDDGTQIGKQEIAATLQHHESEVGGVAHSS